MGDLIQLRAEEAKATEQTGATQPTSYTSKTDKLVEIIYKELHLGKIITQNIKAYSIYVDEGKDKESIQKNEEVLKKTIEETIVAVKKQIFYMRDDDLKALCDILENPQYKAAKDTISKVGKELSDVLSKVKDKVQKNEDTAYSVAGYVD